MLGSIALGMEEQVNPGAAKEAFVLVVDDDPAVLTLVSDALEAAGYRVTTAKDASEEEVQAQGLKVGLIITELPAVTKMEATFEKDWAASVPAVGTPMPPPDGGEPSAEAAAGGDAASDAGIADANTSGGG